MTKGGLSLGGGGGGVSQSRSFHSRCPELPRPSSSFPQGFKGQQQLLGIWKCLQGQLCFCTEGLILLLLRYKGKDL